MHLVFVEDETAKYKYVPKAVTVRTLSAPSCSLNLFTADKCSRILQKLTVA